MSEEQLKAFISKVQADTSLQEQLKAEGADPVAIANAAGFAITTEDHQRNLSDDELEAVSGGKGKASPVHPTDTLNYQRGGHSYQCHHVDY
tara:strand:+ start:702 stop:974 length:273 start_codon:yes stop_codon:yes gene_type:complete